MRAFGFPTLAAPSRQYRQSANFPDVSLSHLKTRKNDIDRTTEGFDRLRPPRPRNNCR